MRGGKPLYVEYDMVCEDSRQMREWAADDINHVRLHGLRYSTFLDFHDGLMKLDERSTRVETSFIGEYNISRTDNKRVPPKTIVKTITDERGALRLFKSDIE